MLLCLFIFKNLLAQASLIFVAYTSLLIPHKILRNSIECLCDKNIFLKNMLRAFPWKIPSINFSCESGNPLPVCKSSNSLEWRMEGRMERLFVKKKIAPQSTTVWERVGRFERYTHTYRHTYTCKDIHIRTCIYTYKDIHIHTHKAQNFQSFKTFIVNGSTGERWACAYIRAMSPRPCFPSTTLLTRFIVTFDRWSLDVC